MADDFTATDEDYPLMQHSAQQQLRQLIEQIERLEEEKKALSSDIKDKFDEAKGLGFDVKVMRKVIALRKVSSAEREESEMLIDTYLHALGMLGDTPLGKAAVAREFGEATA